MFRKLRILVLLLTASSINSQYEQTADNLVELYPYGSGQRDTTLDSGDDLSSPAGRINKGLLFYGRKHWDIFVNTNGVISFGNSVNDHSSQAPAFPLGEVQPDPDDQEYYMIAPFWANVDTTRRGNIYYRQTTERVILNQATEDVRKYFLTEKDFTALWCYIATWEEVSFYGRTDNNNNVDHRNTFQAVITTDERKTFIIISYRRVEWTAGTESGGSPYTGLGGTAAQVGFNAGDGLRYHTYGGSRTSDVIHLPYTSNVEVPGRFAYRIDGYNMESGGCSGSGRLSFFPRWGNLLGGDDLLVGGSCWDRNRKYYVRVGIQEFNCTYGNVMELHCTTPPFYEIGDVRVDLSFDGGQTYPYNGRWIIEPPLLGKTKPKVNRIDPYLDKWNRAGHDLTVTWDQNEFAEPHVNIDIMVYREDLNYPVWEILDNALTREENDGRATFRSEAVYGANHNFAIGGVRIRPYGDTMGRAIWSDVHTLGYAMEEEFQLDPRSYATEHCLNFYDAQLPNINFRRDLYYCPCNLTMAMADFGRFEPDPDCNMERQDTKCTFHRGARHCVNSVYPNSRGSGTQCCYDWEEHLIYAGDDPSGGFSSEAHVWGSRPYNQAGRVPVLSYYMTDWLLYYDCCIWSENCGYYQRVRPTADCWEYEVPRPAVVYGDPHFITFDGVEYSFNGKGEYILLKHNGFPTFEIQGRFEQLLDAYGDYQKATHLTAVVLKEGGSDTVQITISERRNLEVAVNSRLIDFDDTITRLDFEEISVYTPDRRDDVNPLHPINPNISTVYVRTYISGMAIKCMAHDGKYMSCIVSIQRTMRGLNYPTMVGLLGNWNEDRSDDLVAKDGTVVDANSDDREIYDNFGQKWNIEASMFHYPSGRSHGDYHDHDFVPLFESPSVSDHPPEIGQQLDLVCDGLATCEFDVLVSGSLAYGTASRAAYEMYWNYANDTAKETVCEYLRTPINGTKEFIWPYISHNMVDSKVHFECDPGFTLVSNYVRRCEEKIEEGRLIGRWTGIEEHNDCVDFGCPPLNQLYHGGYKWDYSQTVYAICDPPYLLYGPNHRTCQNGVWTGSRNECYLGLPTAGAIGLGVGLAVVAIIVICIIIFVLWRRKQKNEKGGRHEEIPTHEIEKQPPPDDVYEDEDDEDTQTRRETTA
ncbi:sushi domain-containing protein 2-like [Ptychodera flava]|uniref:sushi domain-containing protein 2-like n=1 Tax=Ptychodera flava TaxID=63121 RepID=UPI00396A962A